MTNRFLFYRLSFIINIIAVLGFIFIVIRAFMDPPESAIHPTVLNLVVTFIGGLLYLVPDLAGLGLLKRIRQNREISWQIVNRVSILLLLQFLIQLYLAFGLVQIFQFLYYRHAFPSTISITIYGYMLLIIFLTTSFNIYTTFKLLRLVRKNLRENKEILESIGSEE